MFIKVKNLQLEEKYCNKLELLSFLLKILTFLSSSPFLKVVWYNIVYNFFHL